MTMQTQPFTGLLRRGLRPAGGFTLVELAVVLVVVGLLMALLLGPLVAQQQQKQIGDTRRQLEDIKESLLGFAMANGRLPCPASTTSATGAEDCAIRIGVLPWSVLGLRENDAWGHRFTYAVTPYFADAIAACTYSLATAVAPDCPNAPTQASFSLAAAGDLTLRDGTGGGANTLATSLPVLVISHGPTCHGAYLATGVQIPGSTADEAENADADLVFVSRNYDDTAGNDFGHLVAWLPVTTLTNRVVTAGRLP